MSLPYVINSDVSFQNTGEVNLDLFNTLSSTIWNVKLGLDDKITIGTATTPDVIVLDDTLGGNAQSQTFRLKRGVNHVDLTADPALSQDYTFNFPALPPTGDAQVMISSSGTNIFYDINAHNVLTVRKNPGPLEYISINDAINAISSMPIPSNTNRYVISINAGTYIEPHFTIPSYVFLVGISMEGVTLVSGDTGFPFITLNKRTGIAFVTIRDTDPNYPAVEAYNSGDYSLLHKIEFEDCRKCIRSVTDVLATENSLVYLEYVGTTNSFDYAVKSEDSNTLGGFGSYVSIENFFTNGHTDNGLLINGLNSQIFAQATVMQGDGTGNAMTIMNGGEFSARGLYIEFFDVAVNVENNSSTPLLLISGILFEGCNKNIWIKNLNTTGHYDGYTEYTKTIVPTDAPFFIANKDPNIITVANKGADFTSVYDALQAITTSGPTNRYTIYVAPGVYLEPQLVLKPYVFILGFFQTQVVLQSSDLTKPFIIGAPYSAISKITLVGTDGISYSPALVQYSGDAIGRHFRVDNTVFISGQKLIDLHSTNGPCVFLLNTSLIEPSSPFIQGINIDDTGPNHYPILFLIDGIVWTPNALGRSIFTNLITIKSTKSPSASPNVVGSMIVGQLGTRDSPPIGTFIEANGSCFVSMQSIIASGYQTCVSCPNNAESTTLLIQGMVCTNNTMDIDIQNPNSNGTINANVDLTKVSIVSNNFGVTFNDPNGSISLSGQIYQGKDYSTITNITQQIQHGSTLGIIDTIPSFTYVNPTLTITISGGTGYLMNAGNLQYTVWSSTVLTLPDNTLSWIYVDPTSTLTSNVSEPNNVSNIILGTVKTYGGSITYIQRIGPLINNMSTQLDKTNVDVFGPIVDSGCIGSPGSSLISRAVAISSGTYSLSTRTYFPTAADNITMIAYHGSTIETIINDVPLDYDASGTLTSIGVGKWVKHSVYLLTDPPGGSATTYFFVYGQVQFNSELDAQTGDIPVPPPTFLGNMCPITAIIVTDSDPNSPLSSTRFRDIRPRIGFVASGFTASADHNSLLDLAVGDAHPQYFRTDGTRIMAGDIQLGTNNITGSGGNLLNGVDITNHASRHLPGGADALATGIPISISTSNAQGSASSFSRSDHQHDHGSLSGGTLHAVVTGATNGFMSSADKTKLDNATINDIPSTIMMRGTLGETYLSQLNFQSSNTSYYTSLLTSPFGFGGPNHTIFIPVPTTDDTITLLDITQSLTNKTITDITNTITATQLRTTGSDVIISSSLPPTAGQVLTATSNTNAIWSTPIPPNPGTVTSVALTTPIEFTVSGSPITTSGTLTITKNAQPINTIYSGPSSGSSGVPTFRSMVPADITGTLPVAGQVLTATSSTNAVWSTPTPPNPGTVTSVDFVAPVEYTITGVPITSSGTITMTKNTQAANTVYAGPSSGPSAAPTFRTLTTADLVNSPSVFPLVTTQTSVNNGASATISFIPWQNTMFGIYNTCTVVTWVTPSTQIGKNLTISVLDGSLTLLGSVLIPGQSATGIYTFTFTKPVANTFLQVQVSRTGASGQNPIISGILLKLT